MELRQLRYFVVIAEELNFTRAAKRLHMAQPPLSQQIRRLEKELGVELFLRTKRRVQLTDAGRIFLREARDILTKVERSIRLAERASRGEIGQLIVGLEGFATYNIIPKILRTFRETYPDVGLTVYEMTTAELVEALLDARIQVGFLLPPVKDENLIYKSILHEPLLVALPETHSLVAKTKVPIENLRSESFILFPLYLGCGLYDQIVKLCRRAGFFPSVIQEANQMQTILGLVRFFQ